MNKTKLLLLLCLITCTSQSMDPEGYSSEEDQDRLVDELLTLTGGVDQKTKNKLDEEFLTSFSRCSVKTIDSARRSSEELRKSSVPDIGAQYLEREKRRASVLLLEYPICRRVKRRASDSSLELKSKEPERKKRNISSLPSLPESTSMEWTNQPINDKLETINKPDCNHK